jgi:hypothetical protein
MSWPDAVVHKELELRGVPFSYRYFKPEWSPVLKIVLPDFHPEFTLPNYKIVILILGTFWGGIPGLIDRNALAKVILEGEGWKVVTWNEIDIRTRVQQLFINDLPQLNAAAIRGPMIVSPYATVNYIARFLAIIGKKRKLIKKTRPTITARQGGRRERFRRRKRRRVRRGY